MAMKKAIAAPPATTELVEIIRHQAFTNSAIVAEGTQVQHKNILELIHNHEKTLERWGKVEFRVSNAEINRSNRGRPTQVAYLNEQQATFLITLLRNNEIVVDFKAELVDQFYKMREILRNQRDPEWQSVRKSTKSNCKKLGDTIRDVLIPLAKEQGSTHFNQLYQVYHKMINKAACVQAGQRDNLGVTHLHLIDQMEDIAAAKIRGLAKEGAGYKKINAEAKNTLDVFARIALITERFGKALINEPAKA